MYQQTKPKARILQDKLVHCTCIGPCSLSCSCSYNARILEDILVYAHIHNYAHIMLTFKKCAIQREIIWSRNRKGKLPLIVHATHHILFINFSNMYKRYHAILMGVVEQYLVSYILQLFDFKMNIDADKWANIFEIAWKLSRLTWNDLCVLII